MTKKGITAADLVSQLKDDPEWTTERAREHARREAQAMEWERASEPLIKDLSIIGVKIRSVWELVNSASSYIPALPVLLSHLQREYPASVREGIARALAVREAKFAWAVLVRLFRDEQNERVKDGLAAALAAIADAELLGEVIELARDARNGSSRVLLLRALQRSSHQTAKSALGELAVDPVLAPQIQIISRRRRRRGRDH